MDAVITKQINTFFAETDIASHIDAVGFVVQASLPRLTPLQKFVFDSILALFGKDIAENITVLATFADANAPPVRAALDGSDPPVPYNKLLKFNNSALYADNRNDAPPKAADVESDSDVEPDSHEDGLSQDKMNALFWDVGVSNFKSFLKVLKKLPSRSTELTKQVLVDRASLELLIMQIQKDITIGLNRLETIRSEIGVVKTHKAQIDANKNFTYTVSEVHLRQINLPLGTNVTHCLPCNRTCHARCGIPDSDDKARCAAMDSNGFCNGCGCFWTKHKNVGYELIQETVQVMKQSDDLKKRFQDASGKCLSAEALLRKQFEEFQGIQMQVMRNTHRVRECLTRLAGIALRRDPLSHVDYLDTLILAEQQNAKEGWKDRISQLQQLRIAAEQVSTISSPNYDPFKNYTSFDSIIQDKNVPEAEKSVVRSMLASAYKASGLSAVFG